MVDKRRCVVTISRESVLRHFIGSATQYKLADSLAKPMPGFKRRNLLTKIGSFDVNTSIIQFRAVCESLQ